VAVLAWGSILVLMRPGRALKIGFTPGPCPLAWLNPWMTTPIVGGDNPGENVWGLGKGRRQKAVRVEDYS
jgi:hypothetical protein